MGNIDRTNAWNSVKWIIGHKEVWGDKLPEEFLESVVTVKKYSADVKSLIDIDIEFQTMYNQKEFIPALKRVCKKFGLFVGKISKIQENQAESLTEQFIWVSDEKLLKRVNRSKEIDHEEYVGSHTILNLSEICKVVEEYQKEIVAKNGKKTGNAKLIFTQHRIYVMLNVVRDGLSAEKICNIFGWGKQSSLKSSSYRKYFGVLQHLGFVKYSSKAGRYILTDAVIWDDKFTVNTEAECDWDI